VESDYHLGFQRSDGDIRLEIHREILPRYLRGRGSISSVWDHVKQDTLAGQSVIALPAEELFLILCIHGHKHRWQRLKWIGDIGWMLEAHPRMDLSAVIRRAAGLQQQRAVLLGCFLAAAFLEVPLPKQVRGLVADDGSLGAQAGLIRGRLFRHERSLPGFREWSAYVEDAEEATGSVSFGKSPGFARFLKYVWAVLAPEPVDRGELPVSGWLSFVHYVYRPVRLFGTHGIGLFDRLR
jgi:hypothetical protein